MPRYKVLLAYNGSNFVGWQQQPNGTSVQAVVEESLSTLLQKPTKVVGCGRTDAGVHAKKYVLHFDGPETLPKFFLDRWNKLAGNPVAIIEVEKTHLDFHSRFDATRRSYQYFLSGDKPIFHPGTRTFYPQLGILDFQKFEKVAELISNYSEFLPFCKSNSDARTMKCEIYNSYWEQKSPKLWVYHISANRFLRGMVRLIVGACINAGLGKLPLIEIEKALENQTSLVKSFSAPADGLFLTEILYS